MTYDVCSNIHTSVQKPSPARCLWTWAADMVKSFWQRMRPIPSAPSGLGWGVFWENPWKNAGKEESTYG